MKIINLEGNLFDLKIPRHANLGCLGVFVGTILGVPVTAMILGFLMSTHIHKDVLSRVYLILSLIIAFFLTGILVGIICRKRRVMYAILTSFLYPLLIPPSMLLIYYLMAVLDGQFIHSFIIPIALCPVSAFMGAKLSSHIEITLRMNLT